MEIRPMTKQDLPEVIRIEEESFSTPWSRESFENELDNPMTHYYVCLQEGVIIGYGGFWNIMGEANITNIAIAGPKRGQGMGSQFVAMLMKEAKRLNITAMTLEVRESNHSGIRIYQKNGFQSAGIRKNYYTKPIENALIMWVQLQKEVHYEHGTENS